MLVSLLGHSGRPSSKALTAFNTPQKEILISSNILVWFFLKSVPLCALHDFSYRKWNGILCHWGWALQKEKKEEDEEDEAWGGLDEAENLSSKGFSSLLPCTKLAKKARGTLWVTPIMGQTENFLSVIITPLEYKMGGGTFAFASASLKPR